MEQSELQVSNKKGEEDLEFAVRLQRQFCETVVAWMLTPVRNSPTAASSKGLDTRLLKGPKLVDRCRIRVAIDSQDAIPGLVDGSGLMRQI